MPLSSAFDGHPFIARIARLRGNPIAAYGMAVAAVAGATLLRWHVGGQVIEGVPFITYYAAIIVAVFLGGFWPGVLAVALSAALAWYLFLPPGFSWGLDERRAISLLLFVLVAGINVILVALLNAALERVMAHEENVRVLFESAPNGIVVVDDQGTIKLVNRSTEKLFGYPRPELLGKKIELLVPRSHVAEHQAVREAFLEKPQARPMGAGRDLSGRRKDGSEFPLEIGLNPVGQNGRTAVLATVIDISERKQAQDRQQFLVRELQHRSQNLLAIVQSIAARSLDEGQTVAAAKQAFSGRLQALARAHAMLAEAAWEGAPLAEIVTREFAGFAENLSLSGCDIVVNTPAAQNFALIVHELATNAVKYGALSSPRGRVRVEGKVERLDGERLFSFVWKESGGPPVSQPQRKGFGSVILLQAAQQYSNHVALDYQPEGIRYELVLSLAAIESAPKAAARAPHGVPAATV